MKATRIKPMHGGSFNPAYNGMNPGNSGSSAPDAGAPSLSLNDLEAPAPNGGSQRKKAMMAALAARSFGR